MSSDITHIGGIVWPIFWCNVICWILVYLCICNGVKSVGKVSFTSGHFYWKNAKSTLFFWKWTSWNCIYVYRSCTSRFCFHMSYYALYSFVVLRYQALGKVYSTSFFQIGTNWRNRRYFKSSVIRLKLNLYNARIFK